MNKRLWALLTALALLLPGCGGGGGENRPEIRGGLALYKEDDTFIEAITEGIHRAAAESSREGTWRASISVADAEGSQISQNQQIERFLSLGYDVLCVNLVDRTNAAPIIDKAMEADIPIVFFNREPVPEDMEKWDRLCYVGSDARQSAELEAQIILDLWEREPQALDRNGDGVIQYIMMEGERRHQDTVIRTEGTIQALRDGGLELERLDSGIANWDRTQAQALMAGYLDSMVDRSSWLSATMMTWPWGLPTRWRRPIWIFTTLWGSTAQLPEQPQCPKESSWEPWPCSPRSMAERFSVWPWNWPLEKQCQRWKSWARTGLFASPWKFYLVLIVRRK